MLDPIQKVQNELLLIWPESALDMLNRRLALCSVCPHLTVDGCRNCGSCSSAWQKWKNKITYGNCDYFPEWRELSQMTRSRAAQSNRREPQTVKNQTYPTAAGMYWCRVDMAAVPSPGASSRSQAPGGPYPGQPSPQQVEALKAERGVSDDGYNAVVEVWGVAPFLKFSVTLVGAYRVMNKTPRVWDPENVLFGPEIVRPEIPEPPKEPAAS